MPYNKPLPVPTPETQPFWDSLKRHQMQIQRCQNCREFYFYPRPFCPKCYSKNVAWEDVSGKATLETYVINHRAAPRFEDDVPYVIAIVTLEEGPRLMTNLIGVEPEPAQLPPDMALEVVYDDATDEITLPKFRPAVS
ncbi:MAG: Zn-ribbon domain-containing OB-fold protein [Dehalococcoidia bacterium]|nr:Zn-ribbon domain-containing OB-fold protein [Dehalococcoidia bacterium]